MEWLYYLLEANLYLALFYGFYLLFLQNETFYNSNRYYLLISTIVSFLIPVLQLGFLKGNALQMQASANVVRYGPAPLLLENGTNMQTVTSLSSSDLLYAGYILITFLLAIKLLINVFKIMSIWLKSKKHKAGNITLVEVNDGTAAFSFFNLLFIYPGLIEKQTVLKHEMVHIRQKHSFDILFFEIIQVICWFNPVVYFIKKAIQLLHEYIADEHTTHNNEIHKHEYALFLIQNSFKVKYQPVTNQFFNQSILKRRINMLNKKRTAARARLRLLLVLPLAGIMLCTSTMAFTKNYGYVDLLPEKSSLISLLQEKPAKLQPKQNKKEEKQVRKFPPPVVVPNRAKIFLPRLGKSASGKIAFTDKRLILINGKPIANMAKFYGVDQAEKISFLNKTNAIKKYGNAGSFGAVEITGANIRYLGESQVKFYQKDQIKFPPPVVKRDRIKFPPPVIKPDQAKLPPIYKPKTQNRYIVYYDYKDQSKNLVRIDNRYVVINGVPIENQDKFYGAENTESITILNKAEAVKKYGNNGINGAVELSGPSIVFLNKIAPRPPKVSMIKLPPPVIKPDSKTKPKAVKFRPPVIKEGNKVKVIKGDTLIVSETPVGNTAVNLRIKEALTHTIESQMLKANQNVIELPQEKKKTTN